MDLAAVSCDAIDTCCWEQFCRKDKKKNITSCIWLFISILSSPVLCSEARSSIYYRFACLFLCFFFLVSFIVRSSWRRCTFLSRIFVNELLSFCRRLLLVVVVYLCASLATLLDARVQCWRWEAVRRRVRWRACMHACVCGGSETGLWRLVAGLVLLIGCTAQEKAN